MTSSSDQLGLQAIHDFAVSLAQRAGAMISSASLSRSSQSSSTGPADSSKKNRVDRELAGPDLQTRPLTEHSSQW